MLGIILTLYSNMTVCVSDLKVYEFNKGCLVRYVFFSCKAIVGNMCLTQYKYSTCVFLSVFCSLGELRARRQVIGGGRKSTMLKRKKKYKKKRKR